MAEAVSYALSSQGSRAAREVLEARDGIHKLCATVEIHVEAHKLGQGL